MSWKDGGQTPARSKVYCALRIWSRKPARIIRSSRMQHNAITERQRFVTGQIEDVVVRELRKFTDKRGWLTELFRQDELEPEFFPVMAYISSTLPGTTRGPHEHVDQADFFCFIGPSNFKLRLWDIRPGSPTMGNMMTLIVGADDPRAVLVPK